MILKNYLKRVTPSLSSVAFVLVCFVIASPVRAVVPAPDGGYPGFNTAEGQSALFNLTTGVGNTAVGWFSLWSDTDGSYNTAVGAGTLLFNVGNQSTGEGAQNTAIGTAALLNNTTGSFNTANGALALFSNTTGFQNTANGASALFHNVGGIANTANGVDALFFNTTGTSNTANGASALVSNTTGGGNTAVGDGALMGNSSGFGNIALGGHAGSNITGNNNIAIGNFGFANADNSIFIGRDIHTDCHIAGIYNSALLSGEPVAVTSDGKLGYLPSSARFKRDIEPMGTSSKAVLALKPVTFHYKGDKTNAPQFGLVAEEVAKVNPSLVVRNNKGELHTVRYDAVNAMLLNEFLKEHKTVQELEAKVQKQEAIIAQQQDGFQSKLAQQQKQIEALASGLQKVSAQIEMRKPTPRIATNHP